MPVRPHRSAIALLVAVCALGVSVPPAAGADIVIGTGSPSGVYYQVGRAICRVVNTIDPVEGLTCEVEATPGSIYNLQTVRSGGLQLGVVQSDWQYHAVMGTSRFADAGPDGDLRALFSVHGEPFTLVVREDAGISSVADLANRRVNIGNPGSGQRGTMEAVMEAMGWDVDDFALAAELTASEHSLALCHDRVEAIVYTVGHPNASIAQATGLCNARIIEVSGPEIDKLVASRPFYVRTEIPGGIYSANPDPVTTFGVIATVVASAKLDEETVYQIVSRVFGNIDAFRKAHPAFGGLALEAMSREGLTAPLHAGAARYFREQGLPIAEPVTEPVTGEAPDEVAPADDTPIPAAAAGSD